MDLRNAISQARADSLYTRRTIDVACLSGDTIGDPMAVRGDRVNGKWRVHRADPHDFSKMPAIGILISKSTPTVGVVQMFGPCTTFAGLIPGDAYLVGAVGSDKISQAVPNIGGNGYTWGQQVGHAVASDLLLLNGNFTMIKYIE